jgi:hypothetical protein
LNTFGFIAAILFIYFTLKPTYLMRISKRVSEDFEDTKGATQWPKEKNTKGQTTINKTYIYIIYLRVY